MPCPHCGYCPHCGRSNASLYPSYPFLQLPMYGQQGLPPQWQQGINLGGQHSVVGSISGATAFADTEKSKNQGVQ